MSIQIIDHTYGPWLAKKRQENGAATYSEDIVEVLIPDLTEDLNQLYPDTNILISTAPPLAKVETQHIVHDQQDLIIQFLHTYPYRNSMDPIEETLTCFPNSKIILVTAYLTYETRINQWAKDRGQDHQLKAVFIPMFIQPKKIMETVGKIDFKNSPDQKRIIYFGNLYKAKASEYHRLRNYLERAGWQVDVISKSRLNDKGPILSRKDIWTLISYYRYGIGVGRCALEMYQLGLKVLISGEHWGGLCMDCDDYFTQQRTNFNGRLITGTRDLEEALELLPVSDDDYPIQYIPLTFANKGIMDATGELLSEI